MMTMCVLACLEGRVLSIMAPLKDRSTMDESKLARTHTDGTNSDAPPPTIFNPEDLMGCSFLMDKQEVGQQLRG
jgi:hypothetical protein